MGYIVGEAVDVEEGQTKGQTAVRSTDWPNRGSEKEEAVATAGEDST